MSDTMTGMMTEEEFIAHTGITPDMDADDFLEHFGKKGMKWGQRKAEGSGASGGSPSNRSLNKASRANDRATAKSDAKKFNKEWDDEIDAARSRTKSGENKQALKAAKVQYKADKLVVGSREAKKALNAVREQKSTDAAVAQLSKTGKETVVATISAVAGIAVLSLLSNS